MPLIKRTALVHFSATKMYDLVNDVPKYSQFLPWCSKSEVLEHTPDFMVAALDISWMGLSKQFTTKNTFHPVETIEITLVNGPFKSLVGYWKFIVIHEDACKVVLELEFEFTGSLMDNLFQPIFNSIANSLVDAFCTRAKEVYDHHD